MTLKNFRNVAIVLLGLFVVISVRSEMRGRGPADYGRILEREMPSVRQEPVEVVTEAVSVGEQRSADPMLVAPAAREQWLLDAETESRNVSADLRPFHTGGALVTSSEPGGLTIVGGPDGVSVVRHERRPPVLSGGFGR